MKSFTFAQGNVVWDYLWVSSREAAFWCIYVLFYIKFSVCINHHQERFSCLFKL